MSDSAHSTEQRQEKARLDSQSRRAAKELMHEHFNTIGAESSAGQAMPLSAR